MKAGRLDLHGAGIAYSRGGSGAPLILIHGYPLDRSIWNPVAELLLEDFDTISPDLRGFGESEFADAGRSLLPYAADIAGLLQQLGVPRAYVVGHSMGGYVALALLRHFPHAVAGLGLISSQVLDDTAERKQARYESARDVSRRGVGPVAQAMAIKLSSDPAVQEAMRLLISTQRPPGLASALEAMAERPNSTGMIATSKVPVVVVHGDADALIPVERGREVKAILPEAHYVELHGAGHMPMMENPSAVAESVRFFLRSQK